MAASELHFLLLPLVAQGHIIPMVDLARLIAARGPRVTVLTTPVNAARNRPAVEGAARAGLRVDLAELPFPGPRFGLPEGLENADQMVDQTMYVKFFQAIWGMAEPLEEYLLALPRRPVCLVADACNPWTAPVCERLGIPRLVMHCPSAYFLLAVHNLAKHGVYDRVGGDDMEEFEVPDFPVRAAGNTATLRGFFQYPGVEKEYREALDAEATAAGRLLPLLLLLLQLLAAAASGVTYDHRSLVISGRRRLLISASIHYPRSVPAVRPCPPARPRPRH